MNYTDILYYTKILNVLYVEDDEDIMLHTAENFRDIFKSVITAIDGNDALEKFQDYHDKNQKTYDIVITDIKMPKKDGISLIEDILKQQPNQTIIAISSYNEPEILMKLIDLGIDNFIMKPIEVDKIMNTFYKTAYGIYSQKEKNRLEIENRILQERKKYQKEKIEDIQTMVFNISHQWRQQLSIISTANSGLKFQHKNNTLNEDRLLKNCELINENVHYLSSVLSNITNHLKSDEEKKSLFKLSQNINNSLEPYEELFLLKDIEVNKNIDEDIDMFSYSNKIQFVIKSIIQNSIDALSRIDDINNKSIFIDAFQDEKNIIISIKDNAKGIDDKYIDKVFDLYFTTNHRSIGKGYSLYEVYRHIDECLEGEISVCNEEFLYNGNINFGAKFIIKLPLIQ